MPEATSQNTDQGVESAEQIAAEAYRRVIDEWKNGEQSEIDPEPTDTARGNRI